MFGDQLLQAVSRFAGAAELSGGRSIAGRDWGDEFIVLAAHTSQAALVPVRSPNESLPVCDNLFVLDLPEVYTGCHWHCCWPPRLTDSRKSHSHRRHRNVTPKKAAAVSPGVFRRKWQSARI